jgi:hypothetical protein
MPQYWITVGLLAAALIFYALSLSGPAIALAAIGFLLESAFWIRVLLNRRTRNESR